MADVFDVAAELHGHARGFLIAMTARTIGLVSCGRPKHDFGVVLVAGGILPTGFLKDGRTAKPDACSGLALCLERLFAQALSGLKSVEIKEFRCETSYMC